MPLAHDAGREEPRDKVDEDDHYDELDEGLRHHDERGKDEDYALETERTDTRLTIHHAKVDDSTTRRS